MQFAATLADSQRAVKLSCALLVALSSLCVVSLNLAGPAQASTQGEAIVNAASSMHGKPYCYDGGDTAGPTHGDGGSGCGGSTKGFDCSGLALYAVYQGTGGKIDLPHKASEQAAHPGGQAISKSALQPGDLVFFGGGSMAKAVHVAIYAGHSEVWVAEDYGIPVRLRTLKWIEHGLAYDGAVRFWSTGGAPTSPGAGSSGNGGGENSTPSPSGSGESTSASPPAGESPGGSTPAPPAPTYSETSGSVVHTWTDYSDAGGNEGPEIPSNDTVQIACKVNGFTVADGNTWWYRIASGPWNGAYYGSADAFYNNGTTSGSLLGTPFVDPNVPNC
jgi:cell wall-associated NlpC family hydrolase